MATAKTESAAAAAPAPVIPTAIMSVKADPASVVKAIVLHALSADVGVINVDGSEDGKVTCAIVGERTDTRVVVTLLVQVG